MTSTENAPSLSRRKTGDVLPRSRKSTDRLARKSQRRSLSRAHLATEAAPPPADGWESTHEASDDDAEELTLAMKVKRKDKPASDAAVTGHERTSSLPASNPLAAAPPSEDALSPRTTTAPTLLPVDAATPSRAPVQRRSARPSSPHSLRSVASNTSVRSLLAGHLDPSHRPPAAAPVLDTSPALGCHQGVSGFSAGPSIGDESWHAASPRRPTLPRSASTQSTVSMQGVQNEARRPPPFAPYAPSLTRTGSVASLVDTTTATRSASRSHLEHLLAGQRRVGAPGRSDVLATAQTSGRVTSGSISHYLGARPAERAPKPVVSKFARAPQQLDPTATQAFSVPSADDVPGRVVNVDVPASSVFRRQFVERLDAQQRGALSPPPEERAQYRYLLDFGLGGPPIDDAALGDAELAPRLASGLPLPGSDDARAQARNEPELARHRVLVPDSTMTLGPNMIPFHFIHALTSTVDTALALDPTEVPAMASLLPGAAEHLEDDVPSGKHAEEDVHYVDSASMRAIAYTAQAVAVQRSHTVTKRFADPLRASLGRVVRMSGYASQLPPPDTPHAPAPRLTRMKSGGALWSALTSPSDTGATTPQGPSSSVSSPHGTPRRVALAPRK